MRPIFIFFMAITAMVATAQSSTPFQPVYLVREYMKVKPAMQEDYLKTEALWKKVHQRRIAEGRIISWQLFRLVAPSGTSGEYDYMTVTAYKSGKEMDDLNTYMNWDYITKGMSVAEITLANDTELTRSLVNSQWLRLLERVQPTGKYVEVSELSVQPGKGGELEKLEKMMNPIFVDVCASGKIAGWRFGEMIYSKNSSGGYYRVITTNTINDMLTWADNKTLENSFKKIYPGKDFDATMKSFRDIIKIEKVELWTLVDTTDK